MSKRLLTGACLAAAAALSVLTGCAGPGPGQDGMPADENGARASESGEGEGSETYLDGLHRVEASRLAPEARSILDTGASERGLTQVRLRYPAEGSQVEIPALIGRRAIVQTGGLSDESIAELFASLDVRPVRPLMRAAGLWLVEATGEEDGLAVAARLARHIDQERVSPSALPGTGILQASPDLYVRHKLHGEPFSPNDPRFPDQWFFANLAMPDAWALSKGDASTSVIVVDTGCDMNHPDLAAKLDPGKDVRDGDDDASHVPGEQDNGHGTACAGLVAAGTDNDEGIAGGCPECRLRCVRLLGGDDMVSLSADVEAFNFAFETGAAVVSNSWGYVDAIPAPKPLADAINKVFDEGRGGLGAMVLFAAGNDNREVKDDELLAVRGVLGIGAINNLDEETPFTNSGGSVDLVAPTGTLTTDIMGADGYDATDYTKSFGGTSSACPVAAGIAGLLVSAAPDRTASELYEVLTRTARPAPFAVPDENGHDPLFGYGIIDPVKALRDVLGITDPPPEEQPPPPPPPQVEPEDDAEATSGCACSTPRPSPISLHAGLVLGGLALGLARAAGRRR